MMVLYFDVLGKTTDKAVQIGLENNGKLEFTWLPKSQCNFFKDGNGNYKVEMPYWLFNKNGFGATNWDGSNKFVYHTK